MAEKSTSDKSIHVEVFGLTDVGLLREGNEDNFLVADIARGHVDMDQDLQEHELGCPGGTLFLVCDGMGGALAGEVASKMAAEVILEEMKREPLASSHAELIRRMNVAIKAASSAIHGGAQSNLKQRGMGTTITASSLVDGRIYLGQVGDSRGYILRGDEIFLVTKDQSLLNQLLEAGQITPEEAKDFEYQNVILQAAGTQADVTPAFTFVDLRKGDVLLLCSDGLHGMVGDDVIAYTILHGESLEAACKELIDQANRYGGHDNITAILARFTGDDLPEADGERILYQTQTVDELEDEAAPEDGAAAASWDADDDFPEVTVDG
ncbi:MAG: serine/threonine-protein phosphatase [Deltaproteobacteria bacterium]|nr:serine/threonine-protein phosphatase [Deltaproteobacteria bacterium]